MTTAQKKTAPQVEAEAVETVSLTYRDIPLSFPADPDEWDAEVTYHIEKGNILLGVEALLGVDQFALVMKTRPKNKDMVGLFEALMDAIGMRSTGE